MKNKKRSKKNYIYLAAGIILLVLFLYWQNNDIVTTNISYTNKKIPSAFNGYVIVQISDLHNMRFGTEQSDLIGKVKKAEPDMIVITGDMIDNMHMDIAVALEFAREAIKIAPVYYIPGNHEARIEDYAGLARSLSDLGVILLENEKTLIELNQSTIELMGIIDPFFSPASQSLSSLNIQNTNSFKILLSHRPELIKFYAAKNIDLVFTGHAHGGQIRIPFTNIGLIAPDQGFFPKYTSGIYVESNTTEIVSRGLGNSAFPFRVFNRPEIIVVTLQSESSHEY